MRDAPSILKTLITTTVVIIVISYAYYKTRDISRGPAITITSPINGSSVSKSLVNITGTATNISHLSMNDRQIFTNEAGEFKEELLLSSGYNIITIKASDKFERNTKETLELIYKTQENEAQNAIIKSTTTPELILNKENRSTTSALRFYN